MIIEAFHCFIALLWHSAASDVMEFTWTYIIKAEEARRFRFV